MIVLILSRAGLFDLFTATCVWSIVFIVALLTSAYGVLYARKTAHFIKVNLPSPLKEFQDYTIIHISDIHLGNLTNKPMLDAWVKQINLKNPDLIVMTGDFITFGDAFILELAQSLGQLKAKDGVYCSLGNHDYFQSNYKVMCDYFTEYGMHTLINKTHFIKRAEHEICLAGIAGIVDNIELQTSALETTLEENPNNSPVVLLAHDPLAFKASLKKDVFFNFIRAHSRRSNCKSI